MSAAEVYHFCRREGSFMIFDDALERVLICLLLSPTDEQASCRSGGSHVGALRPNRNIAITGAVPTDRLEATLRQIKDRHANSATAARFDEHRCISHGHEGSVATIP